MPLLGKFVPIFLKLLAELRANFRIQFCQLHRCCFLSRFCFLEVPEKRRINHFHIVTVFGEVKGEEPFACDCVRTISDFAFIKGDDAVEFAARVFKAGTGFERIGEVLFCPLDNRLEKGMPERDEFCRCVSRCLRFIERDFSDLKFSSGVNVGGFLDNSPDVGRDAGYHEKSISAQAEFTTEGFKRLSEEFARVFRDKAVLTRLLLEEFHLR